MTTLELADNLNRAKFDKIKYRDCDLIQSPEMVLCSGRGHCWELTELCRFLLKQRGRDCQCFYIDYNFPYNNNYRQKVPFIPEHPNHSFCVFEEDGEFWWWETSWDEQIGLHNYPTLMDLLKDVKRKSKEYFERETGQEMKNFRCRRYDEIKLPCVWHKFMFHCIDSEEIIIDD